jgi:hypothetical protein
LSGTDLAERTGTGGDDGTIEQRRPDPVNPRNLIPARNAHPEEWGDHFAAPLGSSRSGRLRFLNGAHRIVVRSDPRERGLYRAHFGSRTPTMGVQGGVVTVRYPRDPSDEWLAYRSQCADEVVLNSSIPWDIEVRGGASRFRADLREMRLGSLNLEGGGNRIEAVLPAPSGAVIVAILGGASNAVICRPTGVSARLRVKGGVTNLTFDGRRIGAAGGELDLGSRVYEDAADLYDVLVTGGANNLSIDER